VSDLDLYADLITRKLVSSDGGAVTLSPFVLGDQLRCTLRTYERSESGDLRERDLRVRTLRASIGKVLAAATSGWFRLWIGDDDTAQIAFDATADAFKTAAQGSGIIDAVENPVAGTWVVKTTRPDSEGPWPIYVHTNKLEPVSFVRVRQFKQLGVWWFECRLIQAPMAFNSGHERVLPVPPTVRRIRDGSAGSETEPPVNELQALHLPPDFRGTYFLRWNYRVSKLLGIEDGPDEIAAALNAMFEKGKRFEATNPEPDNAYVEFIGELGGSPQPLITVEVNTFAPGVLTFTLPLDRAEMAAALRAVAEIEVPFEVEAEIVDDGEDIADPAVPGRIITLFQQPVKVVREQIWEEMETVQPIDWLRPPQPRDYIPFTPDQIIVGVQHYVAVFGDGESRSFSFPHNLGTEAFHLTVRENKSAGKVIDGFNAIIASANELTLDFAETEPPPAHNSLAIVISSAGPRSAFLAHTHTMAQILGLLDALAGVYARLEAIEDLLPTPNLLTRREGAISQDIEIPDRTEVFPSARLPKDFDPKSLAEGKTDKLPRAAGLLPAIHDATVVPIAVPLPPALANAGNVFQNTTTTPLLVPGGLGRRGGYLEPQGYAGSDGRLWYRLSRAAQTNSFYPLDFERELFLLHINEAMWQPDGRFSVEFDLELQLFLANTRAQFLLVIEAGTAPGQATPAPVGENLADVAWQPAPLLSQRIIVSGLKLKHHFGAIIKRSLDNVITAERRLYTAWSASPANAVPPSPGFVLRARLIQFDTENSVRGAKGFVFVALTQAKAQITG
jgi:hypothetical protein